MPPSTYLVGGSVRDALLGRQADYLDLDFVMPEGAVQTARTIAHHYGVGFVLLDAEHQIARVVFDQSTVDFAQQVGPGLGSDLRRRDFTVNAIAYNPHTDEILDPLQGLADLEQRQLRMIAPENLKEDPLRLLRAYRQAAQLGFSLEETTRATIRQLAPLLGQVAAERVQGELNYLLNRPTGTPLLVTAWQDGLLQTWLPHIRSDCLDRIPDIDRAAVLLSQRWPALGDDLNHRLSQQQVPGTHRNLLKIAKLTQLLSEQVEQAETTLQQLKYSRAETQAATRVIRCLPQLPLHNASDCVPTQLSKRQQYDLFQEVGESFPALLVLWVAMGAPLETVAPLVDRFLDPKDAIAHPSALVTGKDLMQALQLAPGPQIGKLLSGIKLAHAEGLVSTPAEALKWAATLVDQDSCS